MYLKYFITQNAFLFSQTHSVTETKTPHVTKKDARETEKKRIELATSPSLLPQPSAPHTHKHTNTHTRLLRLGVESHLLVVLLQRGQILTRCHKGVLLHALSHIPVDKSVFFKH